MALLNRFSKLNDRGETGIFTFIVTKSVTRDLHRDATTKDFCFGYHRWAISFQRPTEKMLGVHLLLRNASPSTACVVDFSLTLLNREHFSQNQVYSKKQAKFTITNPMQGVSRWIELSELAERRFSNETGEFLFELSLSNMTTIFECDIQLNSMVLSQYKQMLKFGSGTSSGAAAAASQPGQSQQRNKHNNHSHSNNNHHNQLINLDTNHFTFGSFDWSLTIVPLVVASGGGCGSGGGTGSFSQHSNSSASSSQDSFSLSTTTTTATTATTNESGGGGGKKGKQKGGVSAAQNPQQPQPSANLEPVCRVYLNRLSGFDSLCRVKYRVILGHHQPGGVSQSTDFVDSKHLDQISDCDGRIRGHQFRHTNVLKLASLRHISSHQQQQNSSINLHKSASTNGTGGKQTGVSGATTSSSSGASATTTDLRVHIEMFCANTISEARVPLRRATSLGGAAAPNEPQVVANCSDRNKQNWCVECDGDQTTTTTTTSGNPSAEEPTLKLKLFFLDLQSVPRNHIRYISWIAYLVRHDSKTGQMRDSLAVRNAPHSNYYLQDGMDLGTIMETDLQVAELNKSPKAYLDASDNLTVHIEWVDSLLLFSHLYNNYDALATVQRHQISRELFALQQEFDYLEAKYLQSQRTLNRLLNGTGQGGGGGGNGTNNSSSSSSATAGGGGAQTEASPGAGPLAATNNNNNNGCREPPTTTTGTDPHTGGHRQRRQSSLTKTTTMDSNFEQPVSGGGARPEVDKTAGDGIEPGDDARVLSLATPFGSRGLVALGQQQRQQQQQQLSGRQSQPSDLAAAYQERPTSQMSLLAAAAGNIRCASSMSLGAGQQQLVDTSANYNHHHPSGRLSGGSDLLGAHPHHSRRQSPILGASNRSPRQDASDHHNNNHHHHHHYHHQQDDGFAATTTMAAGQVMAVTSHHHQAAAPLTPSRSSARRRLPQPKVAQGFAGQPIQRDLQSSAQLPGQCAEPGASARAWHLGPAPGPATGVSFENLQPLLSDAEDGLLFSAETADREQLAARPTQRPPNRYHEARHSADSTCATRRDSGPQRPAYSPTNCPVIYPHTTTGQQPPPSQLRSERLMSTAISHSGGGGGGVFMHNNHQPLDETSHLLASPIRVRTLSGSAASKADEQSEPGELDNHNNTGANHQRVSMSDHRLLQQQQQQQHGHYAMKIPFAPPPIGNEPQIGTMASGGGLIQLDDASPDLLLDDNNQLPLEFTQPLRKLATLNGDGPQLQNGHLGSSFSSEQSSGARRRQRSSAEMSPIRMTDQLVAAAAATNHRHLHSHLPAVSSDHIDQLLLVSSTKRALSLQQPQTPDQEYTTNAYLGTGQYDPQQPISPHRGTPALEYRSGSRSDPLVQPAAALATWRQQSTFERDGDSPP